MQTEKDYRPAYIEFDFAHDNSNMPESFGEFENAEQAAKFIGANLVSINQGKTVARHMDNFEKNEIRKEYNDILENITPTREKELSKATLEFNEAKRNLDIAKENVNAAINRVKALAIEVKRGTKEIKLDELFTSRVAYRGRYYFYTFIDGSLRLCDIRDIPESEKSEIWNQMAGNEQFIDDHFGIDYEVTKIDFIGNGTTESQEGAQE